MLLGASLLKLPWCLPERKELGSAAARVGAPRSTDPQALADRANCMWARAAATWNGKMKDVAGEALKAPEMGGNGFWLITFRVCAACIPSHREGTYRLLFPSCPLGSWDW